MLRIDELASCNKFMKKKQDFNGINKICFGHLKDTVESGNTSKSILKIQPFKL